MKRAEVRGASPRAMRLTPASIKEEDLRKGWFGLVCEQERTMSSRLRVQNLLLSELVIGTNPSAEQAGELAYGERENIF
jgi:hypothetical protein